MKAPLEQADPNPDIMTKLEDLLPTQEQDRLYRCIRDLTQNGLALDRFSAGDPIPQRQDITQYLAAWSRHAGLSEEKCGSWLVDYCATVLAPLSKRTPAAIRHSTKSNIRYIYKSAPPFLCGCSANRFKAACSSDCPVHAQMQAAMAANAARPAPTPRPEPPIITVMLPVKVAHRDQFENALRLVRNEISNRTKARRILELLVKGGLKTRTGRNWTYSILTSEISKLKAAKESQASPESEPR